MTGPAALATATNGSLALGPGVARLLSARGVALHPLEGEDRDTFADRLDTALMALWRDSGEEAVFEDLYRHARGRVFEWLRWLLRGATRGQDATELLQDTFVNVYRYGGGFRDEGAHSFRAWVRTIAGNAMRRAAVRGPASRRQQVSWHELPTGAAEPADPRGGPSLRLVRGEETGELREAWALFLVHYAGAFDELCERDRRALRLVEVEGLSYLEASARLRVSGSNMKMIMLRSRRRLQKHMRRAMGVSEPEPPAGCRAEARPAARGKRARPAAVRA